MNYRWVILALLTFSQVTLSIAAFGWAPLAPFLKESMSLSHTEIGTVSSVFFFTTALIAFPSGVIIDRSGVKRGIISWLGFTAIPLLFLGFIYHSYVFLLIIVAIAGVGYGMGNPVASKGLFLWFEQKMRATAFGIRQAAVTIGSAISGVFLVYLSVKMGPFIALGIVGLMGSGMMVLSLLLYKDPQGEKSIAPAKGARTQRSIRSGVKELFANKSLLTLSLVMAMLGVSQGIVTTFLVLYLEEHLGYSVSTAGFFFTIAMLGGTAGRIFWGIISDRVFNGRRKPALRIIIAEGVLSIALLAFWVGSWPKWVLGLLVIGVGSSCVGYNALAILMSAELAGRAQAASASGLVSTIAWLGLFLGPISFGALTEHFGYFPAWISLAILLLLCFIFCSFFFKEGNSLSQT